MNFKEPYNWLRWLIVFMLFFTVGGWQWYATLGLWAATLGVDIVTSDARRSKRRTNA